MANELRSHGFQLLHGEDRAVMGSRTTMIERLVNDARYFAEKMTDAQLISYAQIATGPGEGIDVVWDGSHAGFFGGTSFFFPPKCQIKKTAAASTPTIET
jgi:hypothetical protein